MTAPDLLLHLTLGIVRSPLAGRMNPRRTHGYYPHLREGEMADAARADGLAHYPHLYEGDHTLCPNSR